MSAVSEERKFAFIYQLKSACMQPVSDIFLQANDSERLKFCFRNADLHLAYVHTSFTGVGSSMRVKHWKRLFYIPTRFLYAFTFC